MTNLFRYAALRAKSEKTWIERSIVKVISLFDVLSMLANCVWNNRGQDLEINRLFEVEKNIKIWGYHILCTFSNFKVFYFF